MAEKYDPMPGLGRVLAAVLDRDMTSAGACAGRIAEQIGLGEGDSAEMVSAKLSRALGLRACLCGISGGAGLVIPLACPVHGIACPDCGGLEECAPDCGEACEATGTPSGTVCGITPAAPYRATCDSGHPREARLCARHAAKAGLWCRECFEADGTVRHVTPAPAPGAVARVPMPGQVTP